MPTITSPAKGTVATPAQKETTKKAAPAKPTSLMDAYWAYCDDQQRNKYIWFALPALALPCIVMPPTIYTLFHFGSGTGFSVYLFVAMLLFIGGIVANVGGLTTRTTISLFLIAIVWNISFALTSVFLL